MEIGKVFELLKQIYQFWDNNKDSERDFVTLKSEIKSVEKILRKLEKIDGINEEIVELRQLLEKSFKFIQKRNNKAKISKFLFASGQSKKMERIILQFQQKKLNLIVFLLVISNNNQLKTKEDLKEILKNTFEENIKKKLQESEEKLNSLLKLLQEFLLNQKNPDEKTLIVKKEKELQILTLKTQISNIKSKNIEKLIQKKERKLLPYINILNYYDIKIGEIISSSFNFKVFTGYYDNKPVTIKRFFNFSDHDSIIREANYLGLYKNKNIIPVLGICLDPGSECLVYLQTKTTLKTKLLERHFYIYEKVEFLYEISNSINSIHEKNLIHRNIHLESFLIDEKGNIYLSNFEFVSNDLSMANINENNLNYNYYAPEVKKNLMNYSFQSDIYSLGIIGLEILSNSNDDISIELKKIFNECLLNDPSKRPSIQKILLKISSYRDCRNFYQLGCQLEEKKLLNDAMKYHRLSCKLKYGRSAFRLGMIYLNNNQLEKSLKYFLLCDELGGEDQAKACNNISVILKNGFNNIEPNLEEAEKYFKKYQNLKKK